MTKIRFQFRRCKNYVSAPEIIKFRGGVSRGGGRGGGECGGVSGRVGSMRGGSGGLFRVSCVLGVADFLWGILVHCGSEGGVWASGRGHVLGGFNDKGPHF